uniref:MORN repeat-containing protein 5 n=1 Tax=Chromera velia CCMP2878 TaxID=1169474 RepID=A0A0G4HEA0_9ALVE|eukprot:Cvel_6534.t1-p1 / transcript=Cvel_6534.t1 / gene=Cvel_6534 / organism=Chromera_velia_CCMP2878 / gene_product=Radial spoke head 1 homolog, putative / transcript_product=Radial spoke head 1 homolog, putative / location=Cvel_scaffold321:66102-73313(-) / protein_length=996 / sequence_SO=supercontig / SO=protein_coding / is_pseudo=false
MDFGAYSHNPLFGHWPEPQVLAEELQGLHAEVFSDGSVFLGQYEDNRRHGSGKLFYPSGEVFEGDFRNDSVSGFGSLVFPSHRERGSRDENNLEEDKREEKTEEDEAERESEKRGLASSSFSSPSTNPSASAAGLSSSLLSCPDVYESYTGHFIDGSLQGPGILRLKTGSRYEGEFVANQRSGRGKTTFGDGSFPKDLAERLLRERDLFPPVSSCSFLNAARGGSGGETGMGEGSFEGNGDKKNVLEERTSKNGGEGGEQRGGTDLCAAKEDRAASSASSSSSTSPPSFREWMSKVQKETKGAVSSLAALPIWIAAFKESGIHLGVYGAGLRHGPGIVTFSDADERTTFFEGLVVHQTAGLFVFVGHLSRSLREGVGFLRSPEGDLFLGTFRQGRKRGGGASISRDGSFYAGAYRDGVHHGSGVRFSAGPQPALFCGEWREGVREGPGSLKWIEPEGAAEPGPDGGWGHWGGRLQNCTCVCAYQGEFRRSRRGGPGSMIRLRDLSAFHPGSPFPLRGPDSKVGEQEEAAPFVFISERYDGGWKSDMVEGEGVWELELVRAHRWEEFTRSLCFSEYRRAAAAAVRHLRNPFETLNWNVREGGDEDEPGLFTGHCWGDDGSQVGEGGGNLEKGAEVADSSGKQKAKCRDQDEREKQAKESGVFACPPVSLEESEQGDEIRLPTSPASPSAPNLPVCDAAEITEMLFSAGGAMDARAWTRIRMLRQIGMKTEEEKSRGKVEEGEELCDSAVHLAHKAVEEECKAKRESEQLALSESQEKEKESDHEKRAKSDEEERNESDEQKAENKEPGTDREAQTKQPWSVRVSRKTSAINTNPVDFSPCVESIRICGTFEEGGKRGRGVITWGTGDIYEGGLSFGLPHGDGVYRLFSTNERYEGNSKEGRFHGYGSFFYADGSVYSGMYFEKGGRQCSGEFKENAPVGWHRCASVESDCVQNSDPGESDEKTREAAENNRVKGRRLPPFSYMKHFPFRPAGSFYGD